MGLFFTVLSISFLLLVSIAFIYLIQRRPVFKSRFKHPFKSLPDERVRQRLARRVTRVLDLWDIDEADQLELLGIPAKKQSLLVAYRQGQALDTERDQLGRVGHILAIHQGLKSLGPNDRSRRFYWVKETNSKLGGLRPLDLMLEGYEGLLTVREYVDFVKG